MMIKFIRNFNSNKYLLIVFIYLSSAIFLVTMEIYSLLTEVLKFVTTKITDLLIELTSMTKNL